MALEGTLDTVSLPEVLQLLAAGKTGRLQLDGTRGSGTILVRGGRVAAAETPRTGPVEATADLPEAVFELLRWDAGSFSFAPVPGPVDGAEQSAGVAPDEVLTEAEARLERWRAVEAVVPSLACAVEVVEQLDGPAATVEASSWSVLVAAARSTTVGDVGQRLGLDEVAASGAVRDLVDAGLATVGPAVPGAAAAPPALSSLSSSSTASSAGAGGASGDGGAGGEDPGSGSGDPSDGGVTLLRRLTGSRWTWVDDGAGGRKLQREEGPSGAVPDWTVEGAVAAAPVAPVASRTTASGDGAPLPVAEPRVTGSPAGGPDWADDEALDQAFAGWTPGPSPEAHPLERELVLAAGPEAPEPTTMGEHRLLERLLGTLRA